MDQARERQLAAARPAAERVGGLQHRDFDSFGGKGQGGGVDENLNRWVSQFEGGAPPKKSEKTVGGWKVHLVDVSGTYLAPGGPMMQSQGKKPGYRLLGAIVEAPNGMVFFKCTGPAATISKAQADFDRMIGSLAKSGATAL